MRTRSTEEEDYVVRMIQEAGKALARLRARMLGEPDKPEHIRLDAEHAVQILLGADEPLLRRLDSHSAVQLIGHPERVSFWASLIDVQADAAEKADDHEAAQRLRKRALDLRVAANIT